MRTGVIVVADDEERQREALARALRAAGHTVWPVAGGMEAVERVRTDAVDVVLTDLRMPGMSGIDVLRRVREIQPEVAVILLTAFGSVSGAVEAMKAGAADYLMKPVDLDELEVVIERALERTDLVRENRRLRRRLETSAAGFRLIGHARSLQEVLARAARAAATDATVLIRGESGTGKELLARSIHDLGRRAEAAFVAVNCAALPETLLESELFGHERGAFTGAVALHRGRIERAAGGTLFLDEVGDLPLPVQVKLLRFLQEREFSRLGGETVLRADVRVIAATHRALEERIAAGTFREDLYYRLNVVTLELPPLRERREDIPELVEHFLQRHARRHGLPLRRPTREAMDALVKHDFPGNVRELENALEQALVLAAGDEITLDDLPPGVRGAARAGAHAPAEGGELAAVLDAVERRVVLEALARCGGNQSAAARALGITEGGLRYKLRKWAGASEEASG
uniref:Sigma-54-dependent Fis family transcriptional regulator n=1 Tax=Eiseniibacteriota bacterium TaxID=2212470 RepID=A0A832I5G6_UNCEI